MNKFNNFSDQDIAVLYNVFFNSSYWENFWLLTNENKDQTLDSWTPGEIDENKAVSVKCKEMKDCIRAEIFNRISRCISGEEHNLASFGDHDKCPNCGKSGIDFEWSDDMLDFCEKIRAIATYVRSL